MAIQKHQSWLGIVALVLIASTNAHGQAILLKENHRLTVEVVKNIVESCARVETKDIATQIMGDQLVEGNGGGQSRIESVIDPGTPIGVVRYLPGVMKVPSYLYFEGLGQKRVTVEFADEKDRNVSMGLSGLQIGSESLKVSYVHFHEEYFSARSETLTDYLATLESPDGVSGLILLFETKNPTYDRLGKLTGGRRELSQIIVRRPKTLSASTMLVARVSGGGITAQEDMSPTKIHVNTLRYHRCLRDSIIKAQ